MPWPSTSTPTRGPRKRAAELEYEPHRPPARPRIGTTPMLPLPSTSCARPRAAQLERLYTVGFCIGGGSACSGALWAWPERRHRPLSDGPSGRAATASRPGRRGAALRLPGTSIYGGADAGVPAEAREAFDRALDAAGLERRRCSSTRARHADSSTARPLTSPTPARRLDRDVRFMGVTAYDPQDANTPAAARGRDGTSVWRWASGAGGCPLLSLLLSSRAHRSGVEERTTTT